MAENSVIQSKINRGLQLKQTILFVAAVYQLLLNCGAVFYLYLPFGTKNSIISCRYVDHFEIRLLICRMSLISQNTWAFADKFLSSISLERMILFPQSVIFFKF